MQLTELREALDHLMAEPGPHHRILREIPLKDRLEKGDFKAREVVVLAMVLRMPLDTFILAYGLEGVTLTITMEDYVGLLRCQHFREPLAPLVKAIEARNDV